MPRIKSFILKLSKIQIATALFGLICYSTLLYKYSFQLGDFGFYFKAGDLIFNGIDPYSQLIYVNSPVSAVLYFLISKIFPLFIVPAFIQMLNILGLYYFFNKVITRDSHSALLLAFSILPLLNTTRALIANVQVTGIVLGLVAISISLIKNNRSSFLVALPLWFAFETKPQLSIAFLAFLLFYKGIQFKIIGCLSLYVISSHLAVSIYFGSSLDKLWIEKILQFSNASLREGYEISFWKMLSIFTDQVHVIGIISKILTAITLLLIIYFALTGRTNHAIAAAIFFPLQNSYLHLYDLVPVAIFIMLVMFEKKALPIVFIGSLFLQVYPTNLNSRYLSVTFFVIFALATVQTKIKLQTLFLSTILFIGFIFLFSVISSHFSEEMQIAISLVFPLIVYLIFQGRKMIAKIDSGMI